MSNFKSGSGDLNFGSSGENDESDTETTEAQTTEENASESPVTKESTPNPPDNTSSDSGDSSEQSVSGQVSAGHSTTTTPAEKYPYFVRRNNVGDERDNRLEVYVRDKIADQEAGFRSVLADHLEASEITKTDAREFALLAAFHHPERVAELMEDEGFNALN
ncbi:acyl-CoA dehydrogenase [Halococcus thailandensis]|uniref:acyl-CoA dehydrogenase n=1 Tax=Halococcus thailandensis TaxID=335952 RepID=UPI0009B5D285|nr:acyl-CoA dehydrogenase [Halococcus thailandensis]